MDFGELIWRLIASANLSCMCNRVNFRFDSKINDDFDFVDVHPIDDYDDIVIFFISLSLHSDLCGPKQIVKKNI